jgi:sec-independent protein translocase protein TatA
MVAPLFVGIPGGPELLIVLLIAVLLFGANKLPGLARASGEAMGEFKKGRMEVERELREAAETASAEPELREEA